MPTIFENLFGEFEVVNPNKAEDKPGINNRREHNLNLLKDLTSTSNEVFRYLGQSDKVIELSEFEKLTDAKIEQLIKNIIHGTKVVKEVE
jgi:hypothetical protein